MPHTRGEAIAHSPLAWLPPAASGEHRRGTLNQCKTSVPHPLIGLARGPSLSAVTARFTPAGFLWQLTAGRFDSDQTSRCLSLSFRRGAEALGWQVFLFFFARVCDENRNESQLCACTVSCFGILVYML